MVGAKAAEADRPIKRMVNNLEDWMELLECAQQDSQLQAFIAIAGITAEDLCLLQQAAPKIVPIVPEVVDLLQANLLQQEQIAAKLGQAYGNYAAHLGQWLTNLFSGPHDADFLRQQEELGKQNVQHKIPPLYNAFIMSFLRAALPHSFGKNAIAREFPDGALTAATLRLLDFCQYLTDRAYTTRLLEVTGISKSLLDRLMTA